MNDLTVFIFNWSISGFVGPKNLRWILEWLSDFLLEKWIAVSTLILNRLLQLHDIFNKLNFLLYDYSIILNSLI